MSKPYYEDDFVTLYHGSCIDEPAWLEADVLVTDPPYGVAYKSGWVKEDRAIAGDHSPEIRDDALKMWGDRPALVFGAWDIPRPVNVRHRLLWVKGDDPGMGDLKMPWGKTDEEIYVIGHGWTGKRGPNVIKVNKPPVSNREAHPTPKPVALMERLIEKCPPGVIADPFAGSGATLVAAKNLGRRVIGVELEERYCEIIAKRCAQDVLDIFGLAAA